MECPFVFSSSAEIPVFCPREQCPLHVFSLESSRVVSSFTVLAQGDPFVLSSDNLPLGHSSSGVSPEFHKSDCFSQKHLDDTPLSSFLLPFVCPFPCHAIPYFTYLFFFHSFTDLFSHDDQNWWNRKNCPKFFHGVIFVLWIQICNPNLCKFHIFWITANIENRPFFSYLMTQIDEIGKIVRNSFIG